MKFFSMFSGIGGFELGIEKSKHNLECIGYSEVDKYAESIYKRHFPDHIGYGDATKIRTDELPEFDLLVGGFPCQAFSIAGHRRGFDDTRGTLFFEIARVLRDKRPKYFLLENVKGLLSHDKGKTFTTILKVLSDLGYYVKWEIFNSKNYGVPQNRERLFIEGYSRDRCGVEVLFKPRQSRETIIQELSKLRVINKGVPNPNTNNIYAVENGLSPTLTATDYKRPVKVLVDNRVRKLTPRECERLQGFPSDWTKYGADGELISDTQRYKCIGNAVTVPVIVNIINEMFERR